MNNETTTAPCTSERASCAWRFVLRDRLPTVQEAAESVERPLCESYWWFDGLNFNRPVMCSVSISCHVKHGASVRVYFAEEAPASGFDAAHFAGRSFRMWGPVKLPAELSSQNVGDVPAPAEAECEPAAKAEPEPGPSPEAYEKIRHWSLRSQLIEIQSRAESGRILAQAVRDGQTNDAQRDLHQLTRDLAELADWIGHVQRQHAPDVPNVDMTDANRTQKGKGRNET